MPYNKFWQRSIFFIPCIQVLIFDKNNLLLKESANHSIIKFY